MSRHTSFVVVQERAAGEKPADMPVLAAVPQMLAAGWGAVGSVAPSMRAPIFDALMQPEFAMPRASYAAEGSAHGCLIEAMETVGIDDRVGSLGSPASPRDVLACLVDEDLRSGGVSLALLADLGVPGDLIEQLLALVAAGGDEEQLARLFVALLARSPAGTWLMPEQRAVLEGDVLGRRELRAARAAVQRLLAGVSEENWVAAEAALTGAGRRGAG